MPLWLPRNARPSYASGYAREQSDAMHQNLWDGLVWGADFRLGYTGLTQESLRGGNGTLTNMDGSNWSTDGLTFNGVNEYIEARGVSANGDLNFKPSIQKTMAAWLTPNDANLGVIMGAPSFYGPFTPLYGYGISTAADNTFRLTAGNGSQNAWDNVYASFNSGVLTHLAVTVTGGGADNTAIIYVDGKPIRSWVGSIDYYTPYDDFHVGSGCEGTDAAHGTYYEGTISNAAIWNRALDPNEIRTLADDSFALARQKPRQFAIASGAAPTTDYMSSYYYEHFLAGSS